MLWIKAFHIIAMVTWFAGLFYLPRLFIYHTQSHDEISNQRFKTMEQRLFWAITTPGGIMTVLLGIVLMQQYPWPVLMQMTWLQIKLALVAVLIGYHTVCGKLCSDFYHNKNTRSQRWLRLFNEVPTLLLIAIVLLVELQPV